MHLGMRLRRLRLSKGLTQRELGAPRYTHAYVSTIEAGRRRPSRAALEHFASKLDVGVEELVTGRTPDLEARLRVELHEARLAISSGDAEAAEARLRRATRESRRIGAHRLEAQAEEIRGLSLHRAGRPDEALAHYDRALELLRDDPPAARADATDGKAACVSALGDVRYAIFLLETLLDEIDRSSIPDPQALARVHAGLVYTYLDAGLYRKAAASAAELDRLAPRIEDPARIAQLHMNVARQYLAERRVQDATASLQRAEDAYRQLGMLTEAGGAALARGYVLSREGDLAGARRELERALDVFERTANTADMTRALNELARVTRRQGSRREAVALLERSIELLADGDAPILAWARLELGRTLAGEDDARAHKELDAAIELYARTEQPIGLAVAAGALADLLERRGDRTAAIETYRSALDAVEPLL
jgi:tetratricopeptide (TPR) repeat protein